MFNNLALLMPNFIRFYKGVFKLFFAFTLQISSTFIYGQSGINRLEEFNSPPGIDLNTVFNFHLDTEGFLWFGTGNGLIRYDGAAYKGFQPDPLDKNSIGGPAINCLESYGDSLLIGYKGYGFDIYDKMNNVFYHFTRDDSIGMPNDYVEVIKVDKNNNIWVGFEQQTSVFKFDLKKKEFIAINLTQKLNGGGINEILIYNENFVLVGTYGQGIYSVNINNEEINSFNNNNSVLSSNVIFDLEYYNDSSIWVSSRNGLELIQMIDNQIVSSEHFPLPDPNLTINKLRMDPDNKKDLWIGTREDGVYRLNVKQKTFHKIYSPYSYTKNTEYIRALFFDPSKNLWVGADNIGTFKINTKADQFNEWKNIELFLSTIDGQSITCMLEDSDGKLWIGTKSDGLYYLDFDLGIMKKFVFDKDKQLKFQRNEIRGIVESADGEIWFVASENGVYRIKRNDPSLRKEKIEVPFFGRGIVRDIKFTPDKNLWIATKDYLIKYNHQNKEKSRKYTTEDGLSTNRTRHLYTGDSGKIWVGTDKGLNVINLENDKVSYFLHNPSDDTSLSNNLVRCIFRDNNSRLWVGTRGGLNQFVEKENKFLKYPDFTKKGINAFMGVGESKGILWFCTNNGIISFNPNSGHFFQYNKEDGLQSNSFEFNNYFQAKSGLLYFGGNNGINAFFPDKIERNNHLPPVYITNVKINNIDYDITQFKASKQFELNDSQKNVSFKFSALDYSYPLRNQYRYKLENYDSSWHFREGVNEAFYTNLDPGKYVFHVQGSNNHGLWNKEGDQVFLYIQPPIWETWWFRTFMVISFFCLGISFYYYRIYQLKGLQKKLELTVKKRTLDLQEANEEIQTQNEELSQLNGDLQAQGEELSVQNEELSITLEQLKLAQSQLVQSEKLTTLGILTAGIAHEINNPVNFIKAGIVGLEKSIDRLILLIRKYDDIDKNNFDRKKAEIDSFKKKIRLNDLLNLIKKVTSDIGVGAQKTAKIVKDLRTFSKVENNHKTFGNIHEGIESSLILLKNQYKDRVEVIKKYGDIPHIEANHGRLNQVFMNLLINAIQSIENLGTIIISSELEGSNVLVRIEDTGGGISDKVKDRIFEPFFSTKDEGQGTGLGLTISINIIRDHNGHIELKSEIGKGTIFKIKLPIQNSQF